MENTHLDLQTILGVKKDLDKREIVEMINIKMNNDEVNFVNDCQQLNVAYNLLFTITWEEQYPYWT